MPFDHFFSKIAGVSFTNPDSSSRQAALARCRAGENLRLVREADNPHDDEAVAVYSKRGEQLGYVTARANDSVAIWLDDGTRVEAFITRITGGGPGEHLGANIVLVHVDGEESEQALLDYAAEVVRENLQEWADKSGMAVDVAVRVADGAPTPPAPAKTGMGRPAVPPTLVALAVVLLIGLGWVLVRGWP